MDQATSTLIGTAIGGFIGFGATWLNNRINARRIAASELRATFAPDIAFMRLNGSSGDAIKRRLENSFDGHAIAVEKYRFFVPTKNWPAYDKAWREYYEYGGSVRFFDYYTTPDESNGRMLFHKRINDLLLFAKT